VVPVEVYSPVFSRKPQLAFMKPPENVNMYNSIVVFEIR
jgi:hypothetical protein